MITQDCESEVIVMVMNLPETQTVGDTGSLYTLRQSHINKIVPVSLGHINMIVPT